MDKHDRALELYKVEYERAAERYDNVYRSIWTIFSYLTAVSAGLLAFGSDKIEPDALVCLAASPLLFWFWTTYLPLDRYGNQTVMRLKDLETLLNARYRTQLSHFSRYAHPLSIIGGIITALTNPYKESPQTPNAKTWHRLFATLKGLWSQIHRARFVILLFFVALHVVTLCKAIEFSRSGRPLFRQPAAVSSVGVC